MLRLSGPSNLHFAWMGSWPQSEVWLKLDVIQRYLIEGSTLKALNLSSWMVEWGCFTFTRFYSAFSFAHRAARCRKEDETSIKTLGVWFLCWSRIQKNSAWNVPSVPIHITIQVPRSELAKAASSLLNSCRSRENGGLERYGLGLAIPLLQVHYTCMTHK